MSCSAAGRARGSRVRPSQLSASSACRVQPVSRRVSSSSGGPAGGSRKRWPPIGRRSRPVSRAPSLSALTCWYWSGAPAVRPYSSTWSVTGWSGSRVTGWSARSSRARVRPAVSSACRSAAAGSVHQAGYLAAAGIRSRASRARATVSSARRTAGSGPWARNVQVRAACSSRRTVPRSSAVRPTLSRPGPNQAR
ncbi:hypothetical protein KCH_68700 [Kitasatospora cheerisanensis KCTC 2395]|uniref:Uncharacterized protein n=1 Tax=Kitasatospora cheerisanensis KCTC 2395 TaxID=1348663 RepID=A0A066YN81_9ACTN|nr:hypothetical protein KCH_68700 [Kitasatospora cheerisanensis KCTC 2395]